MKNPPKIFYYSTFAVLILPNSALAYIDPGSGSIILNTLILLFGGLIFSFRSIFLKLKYSSNTTQNDYELIVFSDHSSYWDSYEALIYELIKRDIKFQYITFDKNDPGLKIEEKNMKSRYICNNFLGMRAWKELRGKLMITTTPHIGSPGYLPKPANILRLAHFFHSIADIGYYKKNSLDFYDEVLLAGNFQQKSIRFLEQARGLKKKNLVPVGLPYFDYFIANKEKERINGEKNSTILIGSSWGDKSLLAVYGLDFVNDLVKSGYSVIIRPHPYSLKVERDVIFKYFSKTKFNPDIYWDFSSSPIKSFTKSSILISDSSSLRFDYAFAFLKPFISLTIPNENLMQFEVSDLNENWSENLADMIGTRVQGNEIDKLVKTVKACLENHDPKKILNSRKNIIADVGKSNTTIIEHLTKYLD